jgi:hypothetical protein
MSDTNQDDLSQDKTSVKTPVDPNESKTDGTEVAEAAAAAIIGGAVTSKYVTTISFSLLFAGVFCSIIYFCYSRTESAYYALVATDSVIWFGFFILCVNIFLVAMSATNKKGNTDETKSASSTATSYFPLVISMVVMVFFLGSMGKEILMLLKYKTAITDGNIADGFWKFSNLSTILTWAVIAILVAVFRESNVKLSNLALSGLLVFSFFKVVVTSFLKEILTYFRTDGFDTYLLQ